ncbi:hypothetical protein HAPAU_07090 [Halalkalicoccus paucihalophilus]|uniref:Uncharacterized protein n=1 Tax=Halalkalicoccus paucihalophilus TaxID=1008153 RepID=A0A151AHU9_9EURY|nr:hypothetical protein [Halalkalicoccus paucihalophilus]KYH27256.1 hypothetical protein HAPAU_07090 [Halalkalicoccus paucihalophilus]
MGHRFDARAPRAALYVALGSVGGFVTVLLVGFVLFAIEAFSLVSALLGVALLAGPGLALWVLIRNPDQCPANDGLHPIPLLQFVSLVERLDRRVVGLALALGVVGQFALVSVSPVASLLALFAGFAAMWVLDPAIDGERWGSAHRPAAGAGLPGGLAGAMSRLVLIVVGTALLVAGARLGEGLVSDGIPEPAIEQARLAVGLGIGSVTALLFGLLCLYLGVVGSIRA